MNIYRLIYVLWFLRLFKPEWILAYYVPGVGFIRGATTLFLYSAFLYVLFSSNIKITVDKPFFFFLLSILLSTVFAENNGIARSAFYSTADNLVFYILNLVGENSERNITRLFHLYFLSFLFYGIVGIVYNGLVPFHVTLDNEDAFGPFMTLGVPLSIYMAFIGEQVSYSRLFAAFLSLCAVVASFARGAFLSLCVSSFFIWYRFPRKVLITSIVVVLALLIVVSSSLFFPNNQFWQEMSTVTDATKQDSEDPRVFLWEKAWQIYGLYPILGVGPYNYGFVLPKTVSYSEAEQRGVHYVGMFGRVPHNIYFQVLSELGSIGALSLFILIYSFFKKNRKIQKYYRKQIELNSQRGKKEEDRSFSFFKRSYYYAMAIEGGMIAYLFNGLFYDILYYHWLVDLLILNSLNANCWISNMTEKSHKPVV